MTRIARALVFLELNSPERCSKLDSPGTKGKILDAIERLQAKAPAEGQKVH